MSTGADEQVSAILPLSLLEALRNLDRPVEDGLDELSREVVSKRLGLNPTVSAQIARYHYLTRMSRTLPVREVRPVFQLVDRHADAGRRAARYAARSLPLGWRVLIGGPSTLGQRVGGGRACLLAARLLGVDLKVGRLKAEAELVRPGPMTTAPEGGACAFVAASLSELLRLLAGFEGAMIHSECRAHGAERCRWSADRVLPEVSY